ncbi:Uncharacterized conserved protein, DUF2252 family [Polynucleobacter meluiroseus]|uniref:Uncharacterized conserved protein, DUF2252 family n=1 Tax=Polynucleobacter meluiroseus TaxID=1938814 RepID=A0A240E2Q9_9BURK|nr:DUF2252 domain-containing protein [Polynucleobacter meluiroseus]SNX29543.1 Uncharacterized conserved protein, DUF2252 family [Polynucleobacter meluiroseus]
MPVANKNRAAPPKLKFAVLDAVETFQSSRPSIQQRLEFGKSLRKQVSFAEQGTYTPPKHRVDPITILEKQAKTRIATLIPIRYERMMESPFAFYRGGAAIMAQDLANQATTNITVQLCGDMHVSNFGLFGTAEHRLIFGINDFDETLPGSWEWDMKRLVASAVIACESLGGSEGMGKSIVRRISSEYRKRMAQYAQMPYLELAQQFIGEQDIRKHFSPEHQKKLDLYLKIARKQSNIQVLQSLTTLVGKDRKIVNEPPLIEHFAKKSDGVPLINLIDNALVHYASSLAEDRKVLFGRYSLKDFARKVVGVGSVGTNCMVLYFEGDRENDCLFLQYKEAQPSVLSPYLGQSIYKDMGRRVVSGQRLLQGAPDIFLNYGLLKYDIDRAQGFYLRQLRDMKGGIVIGKGGVSLENFPDYAKLFGWALALGHARSGEAAMISGYCGASAEFDKAMYSFAKAYAKQNEADYALFRKAVKKGQLKVANKSTQ